MTREAETMMRKRKRKRRNKKNKKRGLHLARPRNMHPKKDLEAGAAPVPGTDLGLGQGEAPGAEPGDPGDLPKACRGFSCLRMQLT
jgi:hypothetical protein